MRLHVLHADWSTGDLVKVSPPINVQKTFKLPVEEGSRAAQDLSRAMSYGERGAADVRFTLCYYDSGSSTGGGIGGAEEGEQLASGVVNLRDMWEQGRRELTGHAVQLVDEETGEATTLVISTNVLPTLRRIMR